MTEVPEETVTDIQARWQAQQEKASQNRAEQNAKIMPKLKELAAEANVARIVVPFDGMGDEGGIGYNGGEGIEFYHPGDESPFLSEDPEGEYMTEGGDASLNLLACVRAWNLLEENIDTGFNGDGAYGNVTIDLEADEVRLWCMTRYMDAEESSKVEKL